MVFYRKYRPQTISELDSSSVREKLYSVLSQESTPHAFLFTGPKGLGKTSTARIVAKAVNCEKRKEISDKQKKVEPCNKCDQCDSITKGSNLDVLEIDAASNRGIDEIRELREKVRLAPLSAQKKVYIIDEVHMLTTEAFNALLKTLEEPPAHVIFILCTTESHKVPATILSRCFHIQFTFATSEELKSSFKRIAESESISIEEEALLYIARLSDGSFRDGAKILEEVLLVAGGKKVTVAMVEEKYHISNVTSTTLELWEALLAKDTKRALQVVVSLIETGADMRYFIENMTKELHALLLLTVGIENVTSQLKTTTHYSIQDIKKIAELLNGAYKDMKYSVLPQLPLELAIIEWGQSIQPTVTSVPLPATESPVISASKTKTVEDASILQQLMEKLKTTHSTVVGLLRGCLIESYDGKTLVVQTKFKYHCERLNESKTLLAISAAASQITGNKIDVKITLVSNDKV